MLRIPFLFVVFLLLLSSCDPRTTFYRKVQNNSSYTLQMIDYKQNGTVDTFDIGNNHGIEYAYENNTSGMSTYENCINTYENLDSIVFIVKNDTSKTVEIEPYGNHNWVFESKSKKHNRGGECNCLFTIDNSMIK